MNHDKLSPSVREFVDEALGLEPGLDEVALQRVRGRVLKAASVAVSAGSIVGLHAAAEAAAASGGASGAVLAGAASMSVATKVATGLVALGLVAGGAAGWRARQPASSAHAVATATATDLSPKIGSAEWPSTLAVSPVSPSDAPQRDQPSHPSERIRSLASPVGQPPAAAPSAPSFPEELEAVERARLAVATGDPRRALRELAESDHVGSSGTFTEEREALRIVALCGVGRESDGLRALVAFRTAFPHSMQIARIERACSKVVTDSAQGGHSPH